MVDLHIGDKVSFLDEEGGGTITQFLEHGLCLVETVDGFEIPYMRTKLVPVNYANTTNPVVTGFAQDNVQQNQINLTRLGQGFFLVFLPPSLQSLSEQTISVSVFNNTPQNALLNLFVRTSKGIQLCVSERLLSKRSVLIDNLKPGYLDKYASGVLQVLPYADPMDEIAEPINVTFKVKTLKIIEPKNYSLLEHFHQQGFAVQLYPKVNEAPKETDYSLDNLREVFKKDSLNPKPVSKAHVTELEVDLHIEELVDDMRGMTNGEMLEIQLRKARQTLDEAVTRSCRKVVFIHGVGNGKLKAEVRAMLDNYMGIEYFDASYAKYGFGATEARLGNVRLA